MCLMMRLIFFYHCYNAESWNLNKGEEHEIEKVEMQAIKNLFDLPQQRNKGRNKGTKESAVTNDFRPAIAAWTTLRYGGETSGPDKAVGFLTS